MQGPCVTVNLLTQRPLQLCCGRDRQVDPAVGASRFEPQTGAAQFGE